MRRVLSLACGSATPNDPVEPVDRTLFSFESGADGFTIANPGDGGTVAQSTAFHTDGEHGLQVSTPLGGNWYGAQSLFDLTGTSMLKDCPAGVTFDPAEVHAVWVPERRRGLPRRRSG